LLRIANVLLLRASSRINPVIMALQWLTVAALAFSHGANDSQKAMGVIILGLKAAGLDTHETVPLWARAATGLALAAGMLTLAPGIVKRVGTQIFRLRPLHGLITQAAAAIIIFSASAVGGPVSSAQVISSSVMGVGSAARMKGVHWLAAQSIFIGWFLTIPGSALLASLIHLVMVHGLAHLAQF